MTAGLDIPEFLFPGRLIARRGAARDLGAILEATADPVRSVFLVIDPIIRTVGLLDEIVHGLSRTGADVTVFDGIAREPRAEDVQAGIELARAAGAEAFVGVGGGSALDATKMIALGAHTGVPITQFVGLQPHTAGFPPMILVATTTGTGSEATRVGMYTHEGRKQAIVSAQFVPRVAVLDADLVDGLPPAVLAATALDALSHAIESMMATTSNPLTELFASEAARLILANLLNAQNPDASAAREALLYASFLGGVALNAGVVMGHSLSYVLAGHHGLSHGVGCALALPYCIAYNTTMDPDRGAAIAQRVLGREDADLVELAHAARRIAADAGLPTALDQLSSPRRPAADLALELVNDYPRPTNPVPLEVGRLTPLIACMETGDLDGALEAMKS
jgi:alcohol dehydrogenase class IV